jgi:hypothetical protein
LISSGEKLSSLHISNLATRTNQNDLEMMNRAKNERERTKNTITSMSAILLPEPGG